MAEIKSTLELALERSRKYTLSEKEREEIKQKELQERIQGLFHRYEEGRLHLAELQKEIDRMEEGSRPSVKEGLVQLLVENLSLKGENEKLLKGIEWLKGQSLDEVREHLGLLMDQYRHEKDQLARASRDRALEALKEEGFSGEAIEPNLEVTSSFKEALSELEQRYRARLRQITAFLSHL